jgi:hypothetical protein
MLLNGLFLSLLLDWSGIAEIFRWCLITSLGIPSICDGCQANMSTLAQRKVMSSSSYLVSRSPAMWVVWAASAPI